MLEIFIAKLLSKLVVQLRRRQIRRLYLTNQRKGDVARQVDVVVPGQVLHLEDFDRQLVHRSDLVVVRQRLEGYLVRGSERLVVRDRPAARVSARSEN